MAMIKNEDEDDDDDDDKLHWQGLRTRNTTKTKTIIATTENDNEPVDSAVAHDGIGCLIWDKLTWGHQNLLDPYLSFQVLNGKMVPSWLALVVEETGALSVQGHHELFTVVLIVWFVLVCLWLFNG